MLNQYKEINANEYLEIPEKLSVENFQIAWLDGGVDGLNPKYNIKDPKLTNTTKYLFYIQLENYYDKNVIKGFELLQNMRPDDNTSYENPNVFIGDSSNGKFDLDKILGNEKETFMFHVLIDVNSPNFEKAMSLIRSSNFYNGEYIYKSVKTDKIVVLLNSPSRSRVIHCINGDYDKLFKENDYENLISNFDILRTYFAVDHLNKSYKFTEESAILVGLESAKENPSEAKRIIEEFKIDDQETIDYLYKKFGRQCLDLLN